VPFIRQTAGVPSAFCHRMSDLPLASKSFLAIWKRNRPREAAALHIPQREGRMR
jgi:hypothetical protein